MSGTVVVASYETWVRRARSDDLYQLVQLIDRCTPETLYRRFHGAAGRAVQRELERIATTGAAHRSWVAETSGGLRGTATLAWSAAGVPEAAFLVEDAWFRRGIGRSLFSALAAEAQHSEVEEVVAWIHADNHRAQRFLKAVAPGSRLAFAGRGELEATIPVARLEPSPGRQTVPQAIRMGRSA